MKRTTLIIIFAMSTATISITSAQTTQRATISNKVSIQKAQNPYSLVYEGAITANVKGKINIHSVSYKIREITIAANVYTPPNYDPNQSIQRLW